VIKYKNFKQFTNVFLFLASFLLFFFNVGFASAETTQYRSAGWVGTESESTGRAYTNVTGCQESDDGLYCLRPSSVGSGSSNLFFSAFGRLEDFNIPLNSVINRVLIRVKGRSSTSLAIGVINKYKHNSNSDLCRMKKSSDWVFLLGTNNDKIIEYNTSIAEQELGSCINENNINFHNLTFRIRGLSTSNWFAEIDNFEIAFDYTPPAVTPAPVEFPEGQKGTVWEIGPDKSNLKQVEGLEDVVLVATGSTFKAVLKSNGTVWIWSDDGIPIRVKGENGEGFLTDVKKIAAGGSYALALKNDGTVWEWAPNGSELLFPTKVNFLGSPEIEDIAAGGRHRLALTTGRKVYGWGNNSQGQAGISCYPLFNCSNLASPRLINDFENVVSIGAGELHSLAAKEDGTVWGWGRGSNGQIGYENIVSGGSHKPLLINGISDIKKVDASGYGSLALSTDGRVFEWGWGQPHTLQQDATPHVVLGLENVKDISSGGMNYSYGVLGHVIKDGGVLWEMYINDIPPEQIPILRGVTDIASGRGTPSLAVISGFGDVLGDSDVAPFLRLPWDYEGKDKEFNDVVLQINSYFDHTFPFLSSGLSEPATASANTISFRNKDEPSGYTKHDGYDWGSAAFVEDGDDVLAAAAGTASAILAKDSSGAGNVIKIDHGNGYQTWYEHLYEDGMIVKPGEAKKVEKGDVIGKVGHTGNCWVYGSKGEKIENTPACAHIHFSVLQDKNNDKDFSNNKIDGFTDPFGWMPYTEPEEREDDPWEIYKFMHHGIEKTGNKSNYLWEEEIDNLVKIVSDEGEAVKVGDYAIDIPADEELDGAKLNAHLEPATDVSITLPAIGPGLSITLKDTNGDFLTKLNNPIKITVGLADFPLQKYKKETLQFYSSNDLSVWIKEPSVFDPLTQTLSVEIDHLTHFVIAGERADSVAPTTVISLIGEGTGDNVFSSDVIVNLITEDNEGGSGVKKTYFKIGEEDWTEYIAPLNLGEQGKYVLEYYSIDKDNNNEDPGKTEFLIDKTAPVSALSIGGTEGENGWYVSNPTVTLSAEDNLSGVERLEYSLNGGESFELYETPFEISTEGVNGLLYRAVDKAGNTEEAKEEEIKLDKTPPQSKVYISGSRGQENWYRSSVSLELSGSDEVSGYGGSFYSLDGGESFSEYTETIFFVDEETYEVAYYSVDIAGNKETEKVLVFNIDKTAPVVTLSVDPDMLWPPNGKMVSVRIGGSVTEENLFATVFGASDEYGEVEPAVSNFGQAIKLQARRNGNDPDGRVYAVRAVSEDLAGNEGSSEARIVVPHDKRN
jgi:alpha-tubulin suppressor-like RCC1 family protein/murein DD-endopeptidase MepM/ murein hydrolase activator NlpD